MLAGQGAAPRLATRKHFESIGGIPRRGSQAAAVPAVLDACVTLLLRHGTMSFADTATATMEMLEAGSESWQQNLLTTYKTLCVAESSVRGSRSERLAAVSDAFYRGSIARDLDAWAQKHDALLRYEDLAAHRTRIEQPLAVPFGGHQIYKLSDTEVAAFMDHSVPVHNSTYAQWSTESMLENSMERAEI